MKIDKDLFNILMRSCRDTEELAKKVDKLEWMLMEKKLEAEYWYRRWKEEQQEDKNEFGGRWR